MQSYSKDIAFHLIENDSLLRLRQEEPDQLRMLKMRSSFINCFTLTVILVIERYYQNPYLQG